MIGAGAVAPLVATAVHDLLQHQHAVTRNFPVVGHLRFWLERLGPELRQYVVANNNEERPFSRDQRRWVYASAKLENNYFGFGTDNDVENTAGYVLVRHSTLGCLTPPSGPREAQEAWVPARRCSAGGAGVRRRSVRTRSSTSRA